jgi:ribosome-binding protein aMBF1 (putative translation factor)
MSKLGRIGARRRKKIGGARLSFEVAEEIRRLYRSGEGWTQEALSAEFGVSSGNISSIIRGKVWNRNKWANTES